MRTLTPKQHDMLDRIANMESETRVIGWDSGRKDNQGPVIRYPDGMCQTVLKSGTRSRVSYLEDGLYE